MTVYQGISRSGNTVLWPPDVGAVVSLAVETSAGQHYATDHEVIAHTERGYIAAPKQKHTLDGQVAQIDYTRARYVILDAGA